MADILMLPRTEERDNTFVTMALQHGADAEQLESVVSRRGSESRFVRMASKLGPTGLFMFGHYRSAKKSLNKMVDHNEAETHFVTIL